jgi:protoheme IX farnesyltransferase
MTDAAVQYPTTEIVVAAPAQWGDYLALMKPRVMSLVVFTALTGLVCADTPMNPLLAAVAVLCIAVGAGASGALNMAFDSDIDAKMRRTRSRPVAAGRISRGDAATFGGVLGAFSVMLMGLAVNSVAAALLLFTIVFYALVYTVWLKRSTPQNIVIGGAAGALPPVIGWAAATGHAPLDAWLLFTIIFLWTPPHFWALALNTGGDYQKAGVPMLPVVKGAKHTRLQILIYSLAFVASAFAPILTGLGHLAYAAVAVGGGALFMLVAFRLYRSDAGETPSPGPDGLYSVKPGAKQARDLFAYSILYLFALFAALLIEHGLKAAS